MSLSVLTSVKQEELREKFRLEPMYQYDRNEKDNRVFMSPTILLGESELRHGGHLELDAKKVLSLVTKDILESKDYTLFQIPEITCLHMGYGIKSANKEGKMALSETDAKTWFNVLNLSTLQSLHKRVQANIDDPPIGRDTKVEGEVTEAMEIGFQPRRTNQIYDDTVSPCYSGLLIPEKGSNILCLSILILNSEIRSQKQRKKSNHFESSESEEWVPEDDDIDLKGKIGANKISDFLSFWTLPYLLNYTQRKIQEIAKHHEANKRDPKSHMKTVKKSAWDIILDATQSKKEFRPKLKEKLEQYYTTEKLRKEYTLLKGNDGSPIVLVPLEYVFDTGNPHPLRLEDLGRRWEWEGRVLSNKEFLINTFVRQKEVQMDYFNCMKDAELRQGVDYAFIFPGKVEFEFFFKEVMKANPNVLTTLKHVERQGRGRISPRHAVVKCSGQNLVVCFSYFQGKLCYMLLSVFNAPFRNMRTLKFKTQLLMCFLLPPIKFLAAPPSL